MKRMIFAAINVGDKVTITNKYRGDWDIKGQWGIVKDYDGDDYYVALYNDHTTTLVFAPDEIKKIK